jgi:Protein of unknown function (DUF2680)
MKKKSLALVFTLLFAVNTSKIALAQNTNFSEIQSKPNKGCCDKKHHDKKESIGLRGKEFTEKVLTEKLKISQKEVDKAREEGKDLRDLVQEKGISYDKYKAAILEVKFELIDKAVSEGKVTKERAEEIKTKIKTKMDSRTDFRDKSSEDKKHIKSEN